jgi:uncharacterized protein (TIGR02391 family)
MPKIKLDQDLLTKMAKKLGREKQYIREQISRRASNGTVSSHAAQLIWARELGLGIASSLNRADSAVCTEVRDRTSIAPFRARARLEVRPAKKKQKPTTVLRDTVDFLLQDAELHGRCRDLLLAKRHYDRVVREATTVLDDRIKKASTIKNMNPSALVGKALNPDPARAVIVISSERDEQHGFHSICSGVMLAFRNKSHHNLSNNFSQTEALKFCGLVDALLAVLGKAAVDTTRI